MSNEVFTPFESRLFSETLARMLARDIDENITPESLHAMGYRFWIEKSGDVHVYTIIKRGVEVEIRDLIVDVMGEKLKNDFVANCRTYNTEREKESTT